MNDFLDSPKKTVLDINHPSWDKKPLGYDSTVNDKAV